MHLTSLRFFLYNKERKFLCAGFMTRTIKRTVIIFIYAILVALLVTGIVLLIMPNPTCTDGKLNQKEQQVDCGGPCAPCVKEIVGKDIVVTKAFIVPAGEGNYDVLAEIHNPNPLFGGKKVHYTVTMKDASGAALMTRSGQTFILPNANKYIVEVEWRMPQAPTRVDMTIDKVEWVKFTEFTAPQIVVRNQRFGLIQNGPGYAEAFGLVSNESAYDFHNVTINVILFDQRDIPIAVNKTVQNTLDAQTQREFRLMWPDTFPGTIAHTEMEAETNVFDSSNFMKKYIAPTEMRAQQ